VTALEPADLAIVLEPVPVTGCDVCGALARQREAARTVRRGDLVRLYNSELLNHPHPAAGPTPAPPGARPSASGRRISPR
jgi:hypothetical protein